MIKEIGKLCAQLLSMVKRNFSWHDWVERIQAIVMGLIAGITLNFGEPILAIILLLVATIDPKWFKE